MTLSLVPSPVPAIDGLPPAVKLVDHGASPRSAPGPLRFSAHPTAEEICHARVFEEPLVPIGEKPGPDENAALAQALMGYAQRGSPDDFSSLTGFVEAHPRSPWAAALLTGLGLEYYNTAHYSLALDAWARAWSHAPDASDPYGKAIMDRAAGELAYMYARLGRMTELEALLKSVEGRVFLGPASEKIAGAGEGLWNMKNRPEIAFRCGPLALQRIQLAVDPSHPADVVLHKAASTRKGLSLAHVADLSKKIGLNYQMAFRQTGGAFIVPSVIHWKLGHYAAIIRQEGERYLLQDPTFRNDVWASRQALEAEASGYFLIPPGPLPAGWRVVETPEGETIWGKGFTSNNDPRPINCSDKQSGGSNACEGGCGGSGGGGGAGSAALPGAGKGMAVCSVHLMTVNLNIRDEPVGYSPPAGPPVRFMVRYNHREAFQPANFTYANFGSKWTCDWLSYITDNPQSPLADVNYYARGGGTRTFRGFDTNSQVYAPQQYDQTQLARTGPDIYEMLWPDGSKLVFGHSDGAVGTSRKILLTQVQDPFGNTVTLNYDETLRLTSIRDAIGQVSTLSYSNADPYKITRVTDPFGRFASFAYDSLGRLTNITDVLGLTSSFSYETNGDFVNALITPYGTTTFTRGGTNTTRVLETVYPDGSRERVEFNQLISLYLMDPDITVPTGMLTVNDFLEYRNTYYWDRNACASAYGDYSKARLYHWAHAEDGSTSGIPESSKEPLEARVWYDYPGQSSGFGPGSMNRPAHIGRVLDDGTTQLYSYAYNGFGHVTNSVDPVGRTFSYVYASNSVDLLEVRMTRAGQNELLSRRTYDAHHLPLTVVDASGQSNTYTYNPRGQLLTATNPKKETTTYIYDTNGYLAAVDGPLPGTNDVITATYDAFGRVRAKTDVSGYTITLDYDALDRITSVTHPDGTFEQITYNRLEPAIVQDRAGRRTFLEYDALGQLIKRTDALGRATLFQWCSCGDIKSLTDALGRTTTWQKDVQNRLVVKQYGDGSKVTYSYEMTTSRLAHIVDEKQQLTGFRYNPDNTISAKAFAKNSIFTYDPNYQRLTSRTDPTGTTVYQYYPITGAPSPGAGQLASVDGPLPNDTITYEYDELGRRVSTAINGVASRVTYDGAGRVVAETNALGSFSYTYDGPSTRIVSETFPNGQTTERSYGNNLEDRALQRVTFKSGATPVSEFVYGRDIPAGRIMTWSQQAETQPPSISSFGYDAADQLVSAVTTNSGSLVSILGYTYDLGGNRLSERTGASINIATYNALNEVCTTTTANSSRTNDWDAENRLTAVNSGTQRTEFGYDGKGRVTSIRLLTNGVLASHRRLVWCGERPCEERDALGVVTKRFFQQGMEVEAGPMAGSYYYTRDHLGSVRELTDSNGNVRARYSYDPFGRRTRLAGDLEADFGFAGMFWAAEAGLALTWFRAYDAGLGRWLSRDPLKNAEIEQGANLYAYARNNPVGVLDPLGLCCEAEARNLDDVKELLYRVCNGFGFVDENLDYDWGALKNAQGACDKVWEGYADTLASVAGNYFTCLAFHCQAPKCKQQKCFDPEPIRNGIKELLNEVLPPDYQIGVHTICHME